MTFDELKEFLDEKATLYNRREFIDSDPVQVPHRFVQKENIEIAAFLSSTIAWGNRAAIIRNASRMMTLMDEDPYQFVINASASDYQRLEKFIHRTFQGSDFVYFVKSLQNIYLNHGGLEETFIEGYVKDNTVRSALAAFHTRFFQCPGERTRKHISNVEKGATGKRLNMFLRWMVRRDTNGVDFGLWKKISPSDLMLPLDVHTGRVARKLGLLNRKQNDWKAVEEITAILRAFDPEDPVKYDFALFGVGVFEKF